ncbi:MAG: transcription elongation factor GreA [Minisyncoccia bacterium]|jgi:transcription elongation factor GreA
MQIPRRRSEKFQKQSDEPVYLTEEGFLRLKEKLARLKRALPDRIAEAQRTAAYGDRSDNAEYKLAKSTLRRTNWQILEIEDQIKRVALIATGPSASDKVQIGSTVVLKADGAEKTFQIVGSDESDPARERISYQSPLGAALIGRAKGDDVTIKTVDGPRTYRIIEIR